MVKIQRPPEWGVNPVPEEYKKLRWFDFLALWSSLGVGLLVLQAGTLLILDTNLSVFEAIIISLIGSVIGSLMLSLAGVIGSSYGVPTMVSIRPIMGKHGSYLPTILNIIQLIGWTTFEFIVLGQAATALSRNFLGDYTYYFWLIVIAVWCWLLAVGGPLVVVRDYLEKFVIWIVYIITLAITIIILVNPTYISNIMAFKPLGSTKYYLLALDLVIAMPISWMPLISDYNRFARDKKDGLLGTLSGYTIANTWFYALGALLIVATGLSDVVSAIASLTIGGIALIFIILDETDNAFADIYSTAVSIQNVFPRTKQIVLFTITTTFSLLLAMTINLAQYELFLIFIGASFVPLFAIIIVDYFLVRKGQYKIDEFYENAPNIRIIPFISWIIGVTLYFVFFYYYPLLGSSLWSFMITAIIYLGLSKIRGESGYGLA